MFRRLSKSEKRNSIPSELTLQKSYFRWTLEKLLNCRSVTSYSLFLLVRKIKEKKKERKREISVGFYLSENLEYHLTMHVTRLCTWNTFYSEARRREKGPLWATLQRANPLKRRAVRRLKFPTVEFLILLDYKAARPVESYVCCPTTGTMFQCGQCLSESIL